jgi:hypothetical protein
LVPIVEICKKCQYFYRSKGADMSKNGKDGRYQSGGNVHSVQCLLRKGGANPNILGVYNSKLKKFFLTELVFSEEILLRNNLGKPWDCPYHLEHLLKQD